MLLVGMLAVYVDAGPVSRDTRAAALELGSNSGPVYRDTREWKPINLFQGFETPVENAQTTTTATTTPSIIGNLK